MSNPSLLHQSAMASLQEALVARHLGDEAGAMAQLNAALEAESNAAICLEEDYENEPTRSILYRSAASLALDCGEFERAKSLINMALKGKVPVDIANELRQIYDDAEARLLVSMGLGNVSQPSTADDKVELSEAELEQVFQIMGTLSEAEINTLRNEHSLIGRMLNAMAIFLLRQPRSKHLRSGEFPISG